MGGSVSIDADKYESYISSMVTNIDSVQSYIKHIIKLVNENVMVPGKWYDSGAAKFAKNWNAVKGDEVAQGAEDLIRISNKIEAIFAACCGKEVASHVWKILNDDDTLENPEAYYYIKRCAKSNWNEIITDLTKTKAGYVAISAKIKGKADTDFGKLDSCADKIKSYLDKIDEKVDKINKITNNIVEKGGIEMDNFDNTKLKASVNSIENAIKDFNQKFDKAIKESKSGSEKNKNDLKNVLDKKSDVEEDYDFEIMEW